VEFQWNNISGATNSFLVVTNAQPGQSGPYTLTVTNALGSITNTNVLLTVLPLQITSQPLSQSIYSGTNVTFTVAASGQGPFGYQWQFNGTNILDATNATLVLTNVQPVDGGSYTVIISNSLGSATSSSATLVVEPILITLQPQDQITFRGANVVFSIVALSSQTINYQWKFNDLSLPGETGSSLTLTNVQYDQAGSYSVVLSNALVTLTNSATISVVPVAAWGYNGSGQVNVPGDITNVVVLGAGAGHSLVLRNDGTVAEWGIDSIQTRPPLDLTNAIAVSAGNSHNLALRADGGVVAWGVNNWGQTNVPPDLTNVIAISAGGYHNLVLKSDGTIIAWGMGTAGQTNVPSWLTNAVAIAAGWYHSLALKADGKVVAWGLGASGQTNVPPDLSNVVAIAAGYIHSVALKANGMVVVWGSTGYGLGDIPAAATNVVAIDAGYGHCLALKADGDAVAWGYPYNGETNIPTGLRNVTAIASGTAHNLALVGGGPPTLCVPLANPSMLSNGFSASLPTRNGHVYALEYKNSLTDSQWLALPLVAGDGNTKTLTDSTASVAQRFYRAREW